MDAATRLSTPSRHDWGRNLPFATHSRAPMLPHDEEGRAGKPYKCSCALPWALVVILSIALLIQSGSKRKGA